MTAYDAIYRFPGTGFARVSDIIGNPTAKPPKPAFIAVSRTEWYRGIGQGRFPKGIKLSQKTRVWTWEELHELKARIVTGARS
jgi:predicted DNA-binding transcriptional regulator AlpA